MLTLFEFKMNYFYSIQWMNIGLTSDGTLCVEKKSLLSSGSLLSVKLLAEHFLCLIAASCLIELFCYRMQLDFALQPSWSFDSYFLFSSLHVFLQLLRSSFFFSILSSYSFSIAANSSGAVNSLLRVLLLFLGPFCSTCGMGNSVAKATRRIGTSTLIGV